MRQAATLRGPLKRTLRLTVTGETPVPLEVLNQPLADLDGVGGCAFTDLVAADEELDAAVVFAGDVLADSADEDFVLAAGFEGHGEVVGFAVVDQLHAGGLAQYLAHFVGGDGALEFQVDRFAVGAGDGDAHAGGGDHDPGVGEDFTRLVDHLVLFLVVAVLGDLGVVTEEIVDDLVG